MSPTDVTQILNRLNEIAEFVGEARNQMGTNRTQIDVLFGRLVHVERNGCSKADQHKDHEDRLRIIEYDSGKRPIQSPGVSIGRWLKVSGYRMNDVILLIFALLLAGMLWSHVEYRKQTEAMLKKANVALVAIKGEIK